MQPKACWFARAAASAAASAALLPAFGPRFFLSGVVAWPVATDDDNDDDDDDDNGVVVVGVGVSVAAPDWSLRWASPVVLVAACCM